MTIKAPFILLIILILNSNLIFSQQQDETVSALKITTLSTMLINAKGIGEWGYSALIEVDGRKILFDTGARPVYRNEKSEIIADEELKNENTVELSH